MEQNLTDIWLKKDPVRWIAGAMAGALAGLVALLVAMVMCMGSGMEIWFPLKVPAVAFFGGIATEHGMNLKFIGFGFVVHQALCMFLGAVYAHFTGTNHKTALLGVGLTWGAFSWIFLNNLFFPSFREVFILDISPGASFFLCMVFGVALSSVGFFDRVLRRS